MSIIPLHNKDTVIQLYDEDIFEMFNALRYLHEITQHMIADPNGPSIRIPANSLETAINMIAKLKEYDTLLNEITSRNDFITAYSEVYAGEHVAYHFDTAIIEYLGNKPKEQS